LFETIMSDDILLNLYSVCLRARFQLLRTVYLDLNLGP
jgi:hypothetical protein